MLLKSVEMRRHRDAEAHQCRSAVFCFVSFPRKASLLATRSRDSQEFYVIINF